MLCHYLPQSYLEFFTADGRLHVFDRKKRQARRDVPRNVAAITDYYVITGDGGQREDRVEKKILSDLEAAAAPALRRLVKCDGISDDDYDVLTTFFALLCTRVPAFGDSYAALNQHLAESYFRHVAGTPELAARFLGEDESRSYSPAEFSAYVNSKSFTMPPLKSERVRLMFESAEPLVDGFARFDWWLLRTPAGTQFITSDAPIGFIPLDETMQVYGELTPNVLKFLALSPDVCLMFADRQRPDPYLAVKKIDAPDVAQINCAIALAAQRLVIARDLATLEQVIDATCLMTSTFVPQLVVVEWRGPDAMRSFSLSVRTHHDTRFPLRLPIEWRCRRCGTRQVEAFVVAEDLQPEDAEAYVAWFERPCAKCATSPRASYSYLGENAPFRFSPAPRPRTR